MQNLPSAEIYSKEVEYMPWGILINEVLDYLVRNIAPNARVLDLLCGTGYLAGYLKKRRPDLTVFGLDLEPEYLNYARTKYADVEFIVGDAQTWMPEEKFDAVVCTGGLHHIDYDKQADFVQKLATLIVNPEGFAIVGDPYLDSYTTEEERKIAAAKLGAEYLVASIENGADDGVIRAAIDLISNDIFKVEYKISTDVAERYFREAFPEVEKYKTWPEEETEFGDYYYVLRHS